MCSDPNSRASTKNPYRKTGEKEEWGPIAYHVKKESFLFFVRPSSNRDVNRCPSSTYAAAVRRAEKLRPNRGLIISLRFCWYLQMNLFRCASVGSSATIFASQVFWMLHIFNRFAIGSQRLAGGCGLKRSLT